MSGGSQAVHVGRVHEKSVGNALASLGLEPKSIWDKTPYGAHRAQEYFKESDNLYIDQCPYKSVHSVGTPRIDYMVKYKGLRIGLECKFQGGDGSAGQAILATISMVQAGEYDLLYMNQVIRPMILSVEGDGFCPRTINLIRHCVNTHNRLDSSRPIAVVRSKQELRQTIAELSCHRGS